MNAKELDWNKGDGLIPVIVQDAQTNAVLMLAYMNREAFETTQRTGFMHYWSRSRNELWKKGETSGNVQRMLSLALDCDGDTLLARVEQTGVACHTGEYSCFFTLLAGTNDAPASLIAELTAVIEDRKKNPSASSYTSKLLADENTRLKKVGEESAELIMAALKGTKDDLIYEAADALYHTMVVLAAYDCTLDDVLAELRRRRTPESAK